MRYFFVLISLFTSVLFAQNVVIKGSSVLPGKQVRILIPKDYVSMQDSVFANTTTDFKGSFELRFQLEQPEVAQISIGMNKTGLLVSPGASYNLVLTLSNEKNTSYFDPQPLQLEIKNATDNGLQQQYEMLNFIYNAFVVRKFNLALRSGRTDYLDSLAFSVKNSIPSLSSPFLIDYNYWKLASLEPPIRKLTQQQIFTRFFERKAVGYRNPEYMAMLEQYFGDYFLTTSKATNMDGFANACAEGMKPLLKYIAKDDLFSGDAQLRELVVLMHLNFNYYNPSFYSGTVDAVLEQFRKESPIREHRRIAGNILVARRHLMPGTPAPALNLFDINGKEKQLSETDKIRILVFVRNACEVCKKTITDLNDLVSKYGNTLEVIVIATSDVHKPTLGFLKQNGLNWQVFTPGEDMLVYEHYNIKVFPEIILLLPGQKIGMAPAPPVGESLEFHLNRLMKQIQK
ncbi:MAG TPA: redoxin domain-containing protein [Bacteroidales bacterium]|nr:redoxin domain-containing protein [Bacteroidales bacterium]